MRTKVLTGLILFGAMVWAQTTTPDSEGLPALRGVYFHSPAGWIGLPTNPLLPMETGTAQWLLGFGRGSAVADFPGPHAAVQTSQVKPTFYLRGFPPTSGIYLVHTTQKMSYRELRMPLSGDFIEWAHLKSSDLVPVETHFAGGNVTALTPRDSLKAGEYAIVAPFDPAAGNIQAVFDFGVNP